jgi:starch phosphorylase
MLRDPERLRAAAAAPDQPVQIVIAGKSHPADDNGKRLIQQIVKFADDPSVRHRIVDHAELRHRHGPDPVPGLRRLAEQPAPPARGVRHVGHEGGAQRRPQPLHPDGWWDEWFDGENGWAIPTADGVDDPEHRDDLEAAALYDLVESSVAPGSTTGTSAGCPCAGWRWSSTPSRRSARRCSPPGWSPTT